MVKTTEIQQVEETLHGVLRREFDARSTEFCDAGLRVELDPISRSGSPSNYVSFIEAVVRYPDNDVHDIVFFHVAREGRLVVDPATMPQWITETIDESLSKESEYKPA
jgi:hypothetical protein